jgi:hypothetical protein
VSQAPIIRHIAAFTSALGVENAPAVFSLASAPWESDEQRDEFIKELTNIDMTELNNYGA